MIRELIILTLITFIPGLELRASIPYGMLGNERFGITPGLLGWPWVALVCIVANIVLGWAVFSAMGPVLRWAEHFRWFAKHVQPRLERMQGRLKPYVDKYGEFGVAVFIGVPLPGSGVYTGAVGAFLLGLNPRKFAIANVLGVIIAGAIVTAIALLIQEGRELPWLDWVIKRQG